MQDEQGERRRTFVQDVKRSHIIRIEIPPEAACVLNNTLTLHAFGNDGEAHLKAPAKEDLRCRLLVFLRDIKDGGMGHAIAACERAPGLK